MIPKQAQFIEGIKDKKKVRVRYYSLADGSVLDRICAPMSYGPGGEIHDGLNRYWFWDCTSDMGTHALGLGPKRIVDLQVLGELFDPTELTITPLSVSVSPTDGLAAVTAVYPASR
jgi:hypothetical protein